MVSGNWLECLGCPLLGIVSPLGSRTSRKRPRQERAFSRPDWAHRWRKRGSGGRADLSLNMWGFPPYGCAQDGGSHSRVVTTTNPCASCVVWLSRSVILWDRMCSRSTRFGQGRTASLAKGPGSRWAVWRVLTPGCAVDPSQGALTTGTARMSHSSYQNNRHEGRAHTLVHVSKGGQGDPVALRGS